MAKIAVLGGINIDITGRPLGKLIAGDSNPGTSSISYGGVGRNIAENLCRLGDSVFFSAAFGDDDRAAAAKKHCLSLGMDLSLSMDFSGQSCSTYLCINDEHGDVYAAIADMSIYNEVSPSRLHPLLGELNRCDAAVVDANLPGEALLFLADRLTIPILADPVSVSKAERLIPILPKLYAVKPNLREAQILTGQNAEEPAEVPACAEKLHALGVQNVFLSLGKEGLYYCNDESCGYSPCVAGSIVNTTGCGDALVAALTHFLLKGKKIAECAELGLSASSLCAESMEAVHPLISEESVMNRWRSGGGDHRSAGL